MLAGRLKFHLAVFFTVAVSLVVVYVDAKSQSTCYTLRDQLGLCVPILACRTITQLLEDAPWPLPPSIVGIVKRSHCGTFDYIHHVCCEEKRITGATNSTQVTASGSDPKIRPSGVSSDEAIRTGMSLLQATKCGESNADRVGNGEDAALSEFPWMALLVYSDDGQRTLDCGGSLITDRYVLTAAHCIRYKKVVSVILGEHDLKEIIDCAGRGQSRKCVLPIQEINVEESIYHADYNSRRFSNDIGLIRLISKAVFHSSVQPICLPTNEYTSDVLLSQMIFAGWGRISGGLKTRVLQKEVVPVRTNDYCQEFFLNLRLNDTQMCAGGGGDGDDDICKADSGGPLFFTGRHQKGLRYIQYGLLSAGFPTCDSTFPSIYTKVVSYLPWIAANIAN